MDKEFIEAAQKQARRLLKAELHLAKLVECLVEDGDGGLTIVEEAQEFLDHKD